MAWYVISYDLRRPRSDDDYARLHDAIRQAVDFCWVLQSVWIAQTNQSPREIIQALLTIGAIDDDDGIVVLETTMVGDFRRIVGDSGVSWLNARVTRR
jgi:hypothetical protein